MLSQDCILLQTAARHQAPCVLHQRSSSSDKDAGQFPLNSVAPLENIRMHCAHRVVLPREPLHGPVV